MAEDWAARARAETEAEARFRDLAGRLRAHGGASVVVEMADTASRDEARHARLCADVYRYLGGDEGDGLCRAHRVDVRSFAPRDLGERDRLLYEVVSFCCINESVNAALLTVSLKRASDPVMRDAIRAILKDEVAHARLGWAHLVAERGHRGGDFLAAAIPAMLEGAVRGDELLDAARSDGVHEPAAGALGHVAMNERLQLFASTLRDVVFPGLVHVGIDATAGRDWLADYLL